MATPLEQLDAMRNLAPNWDGYNADPPDPRVIELAKDFLALLALLRPRDALAGVHVSPGRAGGVLIEWTDARFEHEVELEPDGSWGFLHTEKSSGKMTERRFAPSRQAVHPGFLRELREMIESLAA